MGCNEVRLVRKFLMDGMAMLPVVLFAKSVALATGTVTIVSGSSLASGDSRKVVNTATEATTASTA